MGKSVKVAILGSGPAGMFAAQAAMNYQGTTDLTIFSLGPMSTMYGAQYLHRPIPGLPERSRKLEYRLVGDVQGYKTKVYGAESKVPVSVEMLTGMSEVWDIRLAYKTAWNDMHDLIVPWTITPVQMAQAMYGNHWVNLKRFDLIVSTIPRRSLCLRLEQHSFYSAQIWAAGSAPEIGIFYPPDKDPTLVADSRYPLLNKNEYVVCSGFPRDRWYRASRIFGRVTIEWPGARRPIEFEGMRPAKVVKPISTDCDCFAKVRGSEILFVGRYGKWEKGVLSHDAYFETEATLNSLTT
jgi:hypothetical protein